MVWWIAAFVLMLLAICVLPLFFRLDPVNLFLSLGLMTICAFLPFLLTDPFTMCLALGPVAIYLLLLGAINLSRRPFLVSGTRDLAALGLAAAGLVMVGPMDLFFPEVISIYLGPYGWIVLVALYAMFLVLVLLAMRPRLVIYNVSVGELRPILAELVAGLDREARWAGESLALPTLGVQLHLESVAAVRNVALVSSGPAQDPQGWRRLELALGSALGSLEVPRNVRAISLVSAAAIILLFLAVAVSRDPEAVAHSLFNILRV